MNSRRAFLLSLGCLATGLKGLHAANAQQSEKKRGKSPSRRRRRRDGRGGRRTPDKLKVGDPAPDFTLRLLDKQKPKKADDTEAETVQLSSFKGKQPVVLIFGSYT